METDDKIDGVGEKPYSQSVAVKVRYAKSHNELADILGLSRPHITNYYLNRDDAPKKTKQGYDVSEVLAYITRVKVEKSNRRNGGDVGDKAEKTRLECEVLRVKLDELLGNSIPRDQFNAKMLALARIVKPAIEKFPRDIMAVTTDAGVLKLASEVSARVLSQISAACEAEGL